LAYLSDLTYLSDLSYPNTQRVYGGGIIPTVTYTYDNVTNAIGRLIKVSNSNSETCFTAFDKMGRITAHKQRINSTGYTTAYTYNLAGELLEETYPSGGMVKIPLVPMEILRRVRQNHRATAMRHGQVISFIRLRAL
jgi:YD repeat-containing protein